MNDVLVRIPGEALIGVRIPRPRLEAELKKQLALQLYREGLISGGGVCRLAGVAKGDFQYLLAEHGICQQYDVADYREDLDHLAAWASHSVEGL